MATRVKRTTHAVSNGYLDQLDLPHHPGFLKAVRTVEANVPRITRDWLICHGPVTFTIMLPADLTPGTVVEWADVPDTSLTDCTYTVVTAMNATSVTFAHIGRDADGALAAALYANQLREQVRASGEYASLEAFYDDQPRRRASGEADYGVHWHVHRRCRFPLWRVSYIQATGEVYAVQQHGACPVRVLGIIPPDPVEPRDQLLYYRNTYYRTLDKILEGWAEPDVSGFDLAWVERKLAGYAVDSAPQSR